MPQLILMRHAKAVRPHEAPDDRSRGLTGRGRRDAAAAGEAMTEAGLKPEVALISAAARTRETAQHALDGFSAERRFLESLYHASPNDLWNAFIETGAESVIVIGHNPGLADLVAHLLEEAHDHSRTARRIASHFPTAGFAAFETRGDLLEAPGSSLIAAWIPEEKD